MRHGSTHLQRTPTAHAAKCRQHGANKKRPPTMAYGTTSLEKRVGDVLTPDRVPSSPAPRGKVTRALRQIAGVLSPFRDSGMGRPALTRYSAMGAEKRRGEKKSYSGDATVDVSAESDQPTKGTSLRHTTSCAVEMGSCENGAFRNGLIILRTR